MTKRKLSVSFLTQTIDFFLLLSGFVLASSFTLNKLFINAKKTYIGQSIEACKKFIQDLHQILGTISRWNGGEANNVSVQNAEKESEKLFICFVIFSEEFSEQGKRRKNKISREATSLNVALTGQGLCSAFSSVIKKLRENKRWDFIAFFHRASDFVALKVLLTMRFLSVLPIKGRLTNFLQSAQSTKKTEHRWLSWESEKLNRWQYLSFIIVIKIESMAMLQLRLLSP